MRQDMRGESLQNKTGNNSTKSQNTTHRQSLICFIWSWRFFTFPDARKEFSCRPNVESSGSVGKPDTKQEVGKLFWWITFSKHISISASYNISMVCSWSSCAASATVWGSLEERNKIYELLVWSIHCWFWSLKLICWRLEKQRILTDTSFEWMNNETHVQLRKAVLSLWSIMQVTVWRRHSLQIQQQWHKTSAHMRAVTVWKQQQELHAVMSAVRPFPPRLQTWNNGFITLTKTLCTAQHHEAANMTLQKVHFIRQIPTEKWSKEKFLQPVVSQQVSVSGNRNGINKTEETIAECTVFVCFLSSTNFNLIITYLMFFSCFHSHTEVTLTDIMSNQTTLEVWNDPIIPLTSVNPKNLEINK